MMNEYFNATEDFYNELTKNQLVRLLKEYVDALYSDEFEMGVKRLPTNVPKETAEIIYKINMITDTLNNKIDEVDGDY